MALAVRYSLRARHEEIELSEYIVRKFGQKKAKEIYVSIERTLDWFIGLLVDRLIG